MQNLIFLPQKMVYQQSQRNRQRYHQQNILKHRPHRNCHRLCQIQLRQQRSKHNPRHRTREATLLLLSALGGSVAMFVTMLLIRHKTKHKKFMIGIPAILVLQLALIAALWILL